MRALYTTKKQDTSNKRWPKKLFSPGCVTLEERAYDCSHNLCMKLSLEEDIVFPCFYSKIRTRMNLPLKNIDSFHLSLFAGKKHLYQFFPI